MSQRPPEPGGSPRAAIDRVLAGRSVQLFETRRLTRDGALLDVQLSASLFHDAQGSAAGLVVILTGKPFEFSCGGSGLDLLRIKVFSEMLGFEVGFSSTPCPFLSAEASRCPGRIDRCGALRRREECLSSGGSLFYVRLPPG